VRENHPNDPTLNREISETSETAAYWIKKGGILGSYRMIAFLPLGISFCLSRLLSEHPFSWRFLRRWPLYGQNIGSFLSRHLTRHLTRHLSGIIRYLLNI
jgi:hypothetical protein